MSSKKKTEEGDDATVSDQSSPSDPTPQSSPSDPTTPPVAEVEALRARVAELEESTSAAERRAESLEDSLRGLRAESQRLFRELGAQLRVIGEVAEDRAGTKDEDDSRELVVVLDSEFKSLTIAGIRFVRGVPTRLQLSKLKQRQIAALKSDPRVRVTERG